jgi:hypothetical protein
MFQDCAGTEQALVELEQGAAASLVDTRFVDCAAGAAGLVRTAGTGALSLDTVDFHDCASPLLTINTEETVTVRWVTVRTAAASAADAALFQVGSWSSADLARITVVDSPCAVLAFGYYAHVRFTWSIAVQAQTPAVRIPGSEERWDLTLEHVDLWDPDADAWTGLDDWVDGTGNLMVDPLFCDAAGGDYRLQPATPCPGYGAHGVGCD